MSVDSPASWTALATGLVRRGGALRMRIRLAPPAHVDRARLSTATLLLGDQIELPLAPHEHAATPADATWINLWADLPADTGPSAIPQGQWPMRVRVVTGEGTETVTVRTGPGMDSLSRAIRRDSSIVQAFGGPDETMWLRVQGGRAPGVRWGLRNLARDLRSLRYGEPFAKAKLVRTLTAPFFAGRRIVLVGERADTAQDNGFHVFSALRTRGGPGGARLRRDSYYVITADSPQRDKVTPLGHVVDHGSLRHRLLLLHARTLVSSQDIDNYLLAPQWNVHQYRRFLAHRLEHRRVFLQHGVIFISMLGILDSGNLGVDAFVCSAGPEHDDLLRYTGFDDELVLTGLPRFDALLAAPPTSRRQIFVMPTWRKWLTNPHYVDGGLDPGSFDGSDYQLFYDALLRHPRLLAALEQHDYSLVFYPHYQSAKHFADVAEHASPRVSTVTDSGIDLQETLLQSSIVVTDFSSIQADAVYRGLPLVYARFDEDRYHGEHYAAGWFDVDRDGFGPVGRDVESVVDLVIEQLPHPHRDAPYTARAGGFYPRHDTANTTRVIDVIRDLTSSL